MRNPTTITTQFNHASLMCTHTHTHTLLDIDECLLGTHNCQELCNNTDGGFRCKCPLGYQLNSDGVNCTGITYTHTHDRVNTLLLSQYAYMVVDFMCNYYHADIDECASSNGGCHHTMSCSNTEGSFECGCRNGHTPSSNGQSCIGKPLNSHSI